MSGGLADGSVIFRFAQLITQRYGSIEVTLDDGASLTVGPNSDIVIDEYVYDPDSGTGQAAISLGTGVLRMVSGRMPPEAVSIQTTVATVGIRGTVFTLSTVTSGLLKIWVDEGTVTAVTAANGNSFAFSAPAYAECDASGCVTRTRPLVPRAFPPAPPEREPFGEIDRTGEEGEAHGGGTGGTGNI